MSMTINTNPQPAQLGTLAGENGRPQMATGETLKSILSGDSLTVMSTTDFEKLLAKLDLERDEQKQRLLQGQFAAALSALAARYEGITVEQKTALDEIARKSGALDAALAAEMAAQGDLDAASVLMNVEIQKLNAMLEAAKKTPEERQKEIETAEKKEKEGLEESHAKTEESEEIKAQRELVENLKADVSKKEDALKAAASAVGVATKEFSAAVANLDSAAKLVVADALRLAGRMVAALAAEQPEGKPVEEKVNAMIEALGEYADKIEEMNQEELDEKISKMSVELILLAKQLEPLTAGDLPEYEQKV